MIIYINLPRLVSDMSETELADYVRAARDRRSAELPARVRVKAKAKAKVNKLTNLSDEEALKILLGEENDKGPEKSL